MFTGFSRKNHMEGRNRNRPVMNDEIMALRTGKAQLTIFKMHKFVLPKLSEFQSKFKNFKTIDLSALNSDVEIVDFRVHSVNKFNHTIGKCGEMERIHTIFILDNFGSVHIHSISIELKDGETGKEFPECVSSVRDVTVIRHDVGYVGDSEEILLDSSEFEVRRLYEKDLDDNVQFELIIV